MPTSKEEYTQSLNDMLDIVMNSNGVINNADLLTIADDYSNQYKLTLNLIEEVKLLRNIAYKIQENSYYKRSNKKTQFLTLEEKTRNHNYVNCPICDNIVKRTYLKTHNKLNVCLDNALKKYVERKNYPVSIQFNKAQQLLNRHITQREVSTYYYSYMCLFTYNYKSKHPDFV